MQPQTSSHNIKMYVLTIIPIVISILGLLSASAKLPFDVMGIIGCLTLIEHALNGNTSDNPPLSAPVE